MSGTSLDGIDAVLASFDGIERVNIIRSEFTPYPTAVRSRLAQLIENPHRERAFIQAADAELAKLYASAVLQLLAGFPKHKVQAIGCHGQTVLHQPDSTPPCSWQLGDAATLAGQTGIPVVNDFRSPDMLHGGQGAPLAPAFHQYAFSGDSAIAVVNIGGIANVTFLPADHSDAIIGFDTGPGNALSDRWMQQSKGEPYDKDGAWAGSAAPDESLLASFMQDAYFRVPPPKSLDTRYFNMKWLGKKLDSLQTDLDVAVIQSTIAAFTADSIWLGISEWMPRLQQIIVCGGGAHNNAILNRLKRSSGLTVTTTMDFGIAPDDVEACAFAWLAKCRVDEVPGNLPSVTGASRQVLLGTITYPQ